jgi:hypothetical protein
MPIQTQWVASHQDNDHKWDTINDLKNLNMSDSAILNVHSWKINDTTGIPYLRPYFSHQDEVLSSMKL